FRQPWLPSKCPRIGRSDEMQRNRRGRILRAPTFIDASPCEKCATSEHGMPSWIESGRTLPPRFCTPFGVEAFQTGIRAVVDMHHRCCDRPMTSLFSDEIVHLLSDLTIGRMALWAASQFDEVHGFTRVHLHDETNAIRQRNRILRLEGKGWV